MYKTISSCLFLFFLSSNLLTAQNNFWTAISKSSLDKERRQNQEPLPSSFEAFELDHDLLSSYLENAPMEFTPAAKEQAFLLDIPMPNGELISFEIVESPIMDSRIADRYSSIKSYAGNATDHSAKRIRFVNTNSGFYGVIRTPEGQIYLDPYMKGQLNQTITYFTKNSTSPDAQGPQLPCGYENDAEPMPLLNKTEYHPVKSALKRSANAEVPVDLRVFRMAIGTTGEWTSAHADSSVETAMDMMAVIVARINSVFEVDLGIRGVLIEDQDKLIHTDGSTDPYSNATNGGSLLGQNTAVLNGIVGASAYDFGHVLTGNCSDVGGIANLGSFCSDNRGGGVTCHGFNPLAWGPISITLHEMGHQLRGPHTFNNCNAGASGNGHEPGSGSTILSYGGLCGGNNITTVRDDYYNIGTLQFMYDFLNNGGASDCGTRLETENNYPEVEIPIEDDFYIPISTPFELTAIGSDPDGDDVMYTWEQYNLGPVSPLGAPMGNAPSFRSFLPTQSLHRSFPKILDILLNTPRREEVLATYSRDFNFRITARDNNAEVGGTTWAEVAFKATETAGPLVVTSPELADNFEGGEFVEITWDVANTDKAPVNCQAVDIMFSKDGGYNFTDTLAKRTLNDGSHFVFVPDVGTASGRIKIKASESIFFNLSKGSFNITPASTPAYTLKADSYFIDHCNPNIAVFELASNSIANYTESIDLSLANVPNNVDFTFSKNPILPGESATLSIDLTNSDLDELIDIQLLSTSASNTITQDLYINIINNDFSAIVPQTPVNGADAITGLPDFSWGNTPNAESYDIEISYFADFSDLIYSEYNLNDPNYVPPVIFDKTSTVYWRVRGVNECGLGKWKYSAFQTEAFSCNLFENKSLELPIAKAVGSIVESVLFVPGTGTIEDLDLNGLNLDFSPIRGIDLQLKGPDGTTVTLMSGDCFNTGELRVTFNDEAGGPIVCPPSAFSPYQPKEALSAFDGKDIGGDWVLRVEITESGFIPGKLNSWNIESCAGFSVNNPTILTNEVLPIKTGVEGTISKEYLEVTDSDNTSTELIYHLVSLPEHGILSAYGTELELGGTFPQDFIYDFGLRYLHNGNDAEEDSFLFTVTDGAGGLVGVTKFVFDINANNSVGTYDPIANNQFRLFPNPANSLVDIQLTQPLTQRSTLTLYDISGRQIENVVLEKGNQGLQLNIADFSEGLYIVQLRTNQQILNKKLTIVR